MGLPTAPRSFGQFLEVAEQAILEAVYHSRGAVAQPVALGLQESMDHRFQGGGCICVVVVPLVPRVVVCGASVAVALAPLASLLLSPP